MSPVKLDGKVAIVTGGNTGIGRQVAEDLAKRGAKVILACRNEIEGETTAGELKKKTKNDDIRCMKCDLASFKSIQSFVDAFKKKEEELHILVNNAGVMMCPFELTEDKYEQQLQVNYLGHVLLTHLLFDTMKKSAPARIINTTCAAYKLGEIDFDDINFEKREYTQAKSYSQSKVAVAMFTKTFARKFPVEEVAVTMNVADPGVSKTGIHRHMPFRQSAFIGLTFAPFIWFLMKTADDGAQSTLFCCLAEALTAVTGHYYKECKREELTENATNEETQEKLWVETLNMLKIKTFGETETIEALE